MSEFKRGDRIAFDVLDSSVTGTVKYVTGALAGIERDDGEAGTGLGGAFTVSLGKLRLIESAPKLRDLFVQFAMELVRNGDTPEDAIDIARKLQEASE